MSSEVCSAGVNLTGPCSQCSLVPVHNDHCSLSIRCTGLYMGVESMFASAGEVFVEV